MNERIPVTVLTGFLGAGKTTLLNRILSEQHGLRIAVIVNEFGEVGIDHQLLVRSDDEIVEMNNGCICCTVRSDLVEAIQRVRVHAPDAILIETTGLADPAPVIQTFFLDDLLAKQVRLDAIVTVVDARHIEAHWEGEEAREQIAFADVLLLNKTDLVDGAKLRALEVRLQQANPLARIFRTHECSLPLERVLSLRAFDLSRALKLEPQLLGDLTHEHDQEVVAFCFQREGTLDERALTTWLTRLGQERGADLYRLKGILNLDDARRRFVVHGVHMLLDGRPGLPWRSDEPRLNQLVFIGRQLDRASLQRDFDACFVRAPSALEAAQ